MTWTPDQQKVAEEFWKKEPIKRDGIDFELLAQAESIRRERVRKNYWNILSYIFLFIFFFFLTIIFIYLKDINWRLFFLLLYFFLGYFIGSYFDKKI